MKHSESVGEALAVSQHTDTSKNTQAWAVSQHTDTSKNTQAWAVSQHTDTSKSTQAWAVTQHTDTSKSTQAWAVSQHTDTSKNTKATFNCCYALHIYVQLWQAPCIIAINIIIGVCVFNSNLPPALLAEWPGFFTCYCGNTGLERIPKWESAQKVDPGEENSPAVPAGIRTRDLSITSPAL